MQKKYSKKTSLGILCMVFAMTFFTTGCQKQSMEENTTQEAVPKAASEASEKEAGIAADGGVLGEGSREFVFIVVGSDGNGTEFEIHTDKEVVGEALEELGLIEGEESEYGLYVKTVNGVTADYDTDGTYWAFYINDEYAQTGVDATKIKEGEVYSFRME